MRVANYKRGRKGLKRGGENIGPPIRKEQIGLTRGRNYGKFSSRYLTPEAPLKRKSRKGGDRATLRKTLVRREKPQGWEVTNSTTLKIERPGFISILSNCPVAQRGIGGGGGGGGGVFSQRHSEKHKKKKKFGEATHAPGKGEKKGAGATDRIARWRAGVRSYNRMKGFEFQEGKGNPGTWTKKGVRKAENATWNSMQD